MSAQEFWKFSENGIPRTQWNKRGLKNELIEFGLAEDRGEFIYVCGSKDQFKWINERREAGKQGGKVSAAKRNEHPLNSLDNFSSIAQANSSKAQANSSKSNPLSLSPSLSLNTNTNTYVDLSQSEPNGSGVHVESIEPANTQPPIGADPIKNNGASENENTSRDLPPNSGSPPLAFGPQDFIATWNENIKKPVGRVLRTSAKRNRLIAARIADIKKIADDPRVYLIGIIDKINRSDFCRGRSDSGWIANFDWFIRPDTMTRLEEGSYATRKRA
jgi:hypothetical protein